MILKSLPDCRIINKIQKFIVTMGDGKREGLAAMHRGLGREEKNRFSPTACGFAIHILPLKS